MQQHRHLGPTASDMPPLLLGKHNSAQGAGGKTEIKMSSGLPDPGPAGAHLWGPPRAFGPETRGCGRREREVRASQLRWWGAGQGTRRAPGPPTLAAQSPAGRKTFPLHRPVVAAARHGLSLAQETTEHPDHRATLLAPKCLPTQGP